MEWKNNILIGLLLLFVGILAGTMLTRHTQINLPLPEMEIVRDTVTEVFIDTHIVHNPVPYKVIVRDTIYIDNFCQSGQLFVHEIKEYGDSTYYARISGINANLEEWRTYPKTVTQYITTTEKVYQKPKKWGLGISVGYCYTDKFQPYIGVGITYDIIQW